MRILSEARLFGTQAVRPAINKKGGSIMKKRLFLTCVMLGLPFLLFAQSAVKEMQEIPVKKVSFNTVKRNPFLSKEEIQQIERMRIAEEQRLEAQREAERIAAIEEQKRLIRQRILEEEMLRHPSREISDKLKINGILGKQAIVNQEVVGIGSKVLGAKVVAITDKSVWFVYKGERFERKLPLL